MLTRCGIMALVAAYLNFLSQMIANPPFCQLVSKVRSLPVWEEPAVTSCLEESCGHFLSGRSLQSLPVWKNPAVTSCVGGACSHFLCGRSLWSHPVWEEPAVTSCVGGACGHFLSPPLQVLELRSMDAAFLLPENIFRDKCPYVALLPVVNISDTGLL